MGLSPPKGNEKMLQRNRTVPAQGDSKNPRMPWESLGGVPSWQRLQRVYWGCMAEISYIRVRRVCISAYISTYVFICGLVQCYQKRVEASQTHYGPKGEETDQNLQSREKQS